MKTSKADQELPAAEYVDPSALVPWKKNPRKVDRQSVMRVADSIQEFGFGAPILARAQTREVISGHTRLRAAIELGLDRVPVRFMDLDERQAHLMALADNRLTELTEWDDAALSEVFADYEAEELMLARWDPDEVDGIRDEPGSNNQPVPAIGLDAGKLGGQPCIRDTRIPVTTVVRAVARGMSFSAIVTDYPRLTRNDIKEALLYAAQLAERPGVRVITPDEAHEEAERARGNE